MALVLINGKRAKDHGSLDDALFENAHPVPAGKPHKGSETTPAVAPFEVWADGCDGDCETEDDPEEGS